ncbi:hypothetical protein [Flavobacterium sp. UBA6031]|uniref:hypothetical protein n=1 Tax=Flavobacterium sp. UBA6031 TaxID=1946551 RepID=UPI0025C411E3|nr:hypothetical protein [Flavobacterium sp. UBA6031]
MALDYQTAYQAFTAVQNSKLAELRKSLYKAAVHYAIIRAEWEFQSIDERVDSVRSIVHNRFIDSCNILSREQAKIGEDNSWRSAIGTDRKMVGDWACYLNCFIGIRNR